MLLNLTARPLRECLTFPSSDRTGETTGVTGCSSSERQPLFSVGTPDLQTQETQEVLQHLKPHTTTQNVSYTDGLLCIVLFYVVFISVLW